MPRLTLFSGSCLSRCKSRTFQPNVLETRYEGLLERFLGHFLQAVYIGIDHTELLQQLVPPTGPFTDTHWGVVMFDGLAVQRTKTVVADYFQLVR